MNLAEKLQQKYSVETIYEIVTYIGADNQRFAELMNLILASRDKPAQYTSWIMTHCTDKNPQLFLPYIEHCLAILKEKNVHDSLKRNIVRTLQTCDFPEYLLGDVYDACFALFDNPQESIAVRAFSMTVLDKVAQIYPELAPELCAAIQNHLPFGSAGFKNRGGKILKFWEKNNS